METRFVIERLCSTVVQLLDLRYKSGTSACCNTFDMFQSWRSGEIAILLFLYRGDADNISVYVRSALSETAESVNRMGTS